MSLYVHTNLNYISNFIYLYKFSAYTALLCSLKPISPYMKSPSGDLKQGIYCITYPPIVST